MAGWLLFAVQAGLAALLITSGVGKAFDSTNFRRALAASGFGGTLVPAASVILPMSEVAAAFGLVLGTEGSVRIGLVAATSLFALFTGWVVVMLWRGQRISCGCFGATTHPVTWRTLARNLALLSIAAGASVAAFTVSPVVVPLQPAGVATVLGSAILVALVAAFRIGRPALTLSSRELEIPASSEGMTR